MHSETHALLYGTNPLNRQKLDSKKLLGISRPSLPLPRGCSWPGPRLRPRRPALGARGGGQLAAAAREGGAPGPREAGGRQLQVSRRSCGRAWGQSRAAVSDPQPPSLQPRGRAPGALLGAACRLAGDAGP